MTAERIRVGIIGCGKIAVTHSGALKQIPDVDFTACCDVSQPTVSHHLKVLREAGWVDSERRGTWIWYRLRPEAVGRFRELAGGFAPGPARRVTGTDRQLSVVQPTA